MNLTFPQKAAICEKGKYIWQQINRFDYLVFILCILAVLGFSDQITGFLLNFFVPWLSFERNGWTDGMILLASTALFLYAKDRGPAVYARKHILIYAVAWFMFIFYSIDPTFCYTKVFAVIPYYLLPLAGMGIGGAIRYYSKKKKSDEAHKTTYNIQTDVPICRNEDDILGYAPLVTEIVKIIENDIEQCSFSIGIVAPWGSGKSSFLNLLKLQFNNKENIIFIEFNPRSSSSVKNIQEDFLNLLRDKMKEYHSSFNSYINDYMKTLQLIDEKNPLSSWMSHFGLDSVENSRKKISDVIMTSGKKLVVLIDDLDRLTGEEIIEVLKLIDNNASFPNTFFVSAYDKEYINQVLKNFLGNDAGHDFTDKFFNLERVLPERSYKEKFNIIVNLLEKAAIEGLINNENYELTNMLMEVQNECEIYLPTVRDIKRFYNMFIIDYLQVKNNVILKEYFYLSLIKYAEPAEYRKLLVHEYIMKSTTPGCEHKYQLRGNVTPDNVKCYDILNKLFPDTVIHSNSLNNDYFRHISYIRAFDVYFRGYMIGRLYYNDLASLMNEEISLFQVAKKFKQWKSIDKQLDIMDYMLAIDYNNLPSMSKLERYIQVLLIFTSIYGLNFSIQTTLSQICTKKQFEKINKSLMIKFLDESQFKMYIEGIFISMDSPLYPTHFLSWLIRYIANNEFVDAPIFSFDDIRKMCIQNLHHAICIVSPGGFKAPFIDYDDFVTPSPIYTLMRACVDHYEWDNSILSEEALEAVRKSMIELPLFYAPYLLTHIQGSNNKNEIMMIFNPSIVFEQLFPAEHTYLFDNYLMSLKNHECARSNKSLYYETLSLFWERYKNVDERYIKRTTHIDITAGDYEFYLSYLRN